MASYRIYVVDSEGHISSPPAAIQCNDDAEAIKAAEKACLSADVELWQNERFILICPL